ncbi:unnamed protein product [Diatraea saccharalis]|uniref:Uncharacterized protein n=1 Tax=Diatraea saccharalis TaxID=40085 RepID=A0A9N9R6K3_9NEOP|nr:unnamed protein product [Diatraea saccharalis]
MLRYDSQLTYTLQKNRPPVTLSVQEHVELLKVQIADQIREKQHRSELIKPINDGDDYQYVDIQNRPMTPINEFDERKKDNKFEGISDSTYNRDGRFPDEATKANKEGTKEEKRQKEESGNATSGDILQKENIQRRYTVQPNEAAALSRAFHTDTGWCVVTRCNIKKICLSAVWVDCLNIDESTLCCREKVPPGTYFKIPGPGLCARVVRGVLHGRPTALDGGPVQ